MRESDTSRFPRPRKEFFLGNSNRSPSVTGLTRRTTGCAFFFGNPKRNPWSNDLTSRAAGFGCRLVMEMPSGRSIVHIHSQRKSVRCVANPERRRQWLHCLTHLEMEGWPDQRAQEVKLRSRTPDATARRRYLWSRIRLLGGARAWLLWAVWGMEI